MSTPFSLCAFMNKKNFFLIGLVLLMAGIYVVYFSGWFRTRSIIIDHTSRPVSTRSAGRFGGRLGARAGARTGAQTATTYPLFFGLDDYYELTEIKVVPLAALQTNPMTPPVWHLVGDPGSDSIKSFTYGQSVEGMVPAINGLQPEPLETGVIYRLFVTDGKLKGQHDFHLGAAPANTSTNKSPAH
jgi:hypothetical protein